MKNWKHNRLKDKNEKKHESEKQISSQSAETKFLSFLLFSYLTCYHKKFQIYIQSRVIIM